MGKRVDAGKVVWFPPELNDHPVGFYRVHVKDVEEGNLISPVYGDYVQWVDDAPDDPVDGSGHFEVYGKELDDAYKPRTVKS